MKELDERCKHLKTADLELTPLHEAKMSTSLLASFTPPDDNYFEKVAMLFKQYEWLLHFKWTQVFTHDVISSVPQEWHEFLEQLRPLQLQRIMVNMEVDKSFSECPLSLSCFIKRCEELSIRLRWPSYDVTVDPGAREHRTSEKKIREVKHVAELIDTSIREACPDELPVIIDIGCGLGYLTKKFSSRGFTTIGIDARGDLCVRAASAKDRTGANFVEMTVDDSDECLKSILDLVPPGREAVLIGLHSCGDLLNHIISLFSKSSRFKAMFCVTCCYHKIDKRQFPRSAIFRKAAESEEVAFNPVVLRVGTQRTPISWSYDLNEINLEAHTKSAAFRGILQEVIESKPFEWKKQRSKMKLQNHFKGYIEQVIKGFKEEDRNEAESLLDALAKEREAQTSFVRSLKILQTLIQPVVESAIVYDHLLHLQELGQSCWAVQCFSQVISPRNLLVISMKNQSVK